jgi:hypothetical protein
MRQLETVSQLLGELLDCAGLACEPYGVTSDGPFVSAPVALSVNRATRRAHLRLATPGRVEENPPGSPRRAGIDLVAPAGRRVVQGTGNGR